MQPSVSSVTNRVAELAPPAEKAGSKSFRLNVSIAERIRDMGPSKYERGSDRLMRNLRASARGRMLAALPYRVNGSGGVSGRTSWSDTSARRPLIFLCAVMHHCSACRAWSIRDPMASVTTAFIASTSRAGSTKLFTTSFHSFAAGSLFRRRRDLKASRHDSHARFRSFSACSAVPLGVCNEAKTPSSTPRSREHSRRAAGSRPAFVEAS